MAKIKLSLPVLLPLVWEAYGTKKLQAQAAPSEICLYDGPCAIGLGVPEAQRARLDKTGLSIETLIRNGMVEIAEGEQLSEYGKLQGYHDGWSDYRTTSISKVTIEKREKDFVAYLIKLSQKYNVEIPDGYLNDS